MSYKDFLLQVHKVKLYTSTVKKNKQTNAMALRKVEFSILAVGKVADKFWLLIRSRSGFIYVLPYRPSFNAFRSAS